MSPKIEPVAPTGNRPDIQELLDAATTSTGGAQNVFLTMARNPGLFRRFAGFSGKLFAAGKLPARDRELAILRVAWLCRSEYEWGQHDRIGQDVGLTPAEVAAVAEGPGSAVWSAWDQAVLQATTELVEHHAVSDASWDALAGRWSDPDLIEFLLLVGKYVMLAGFLNSAQVALEPGTMGFPDGS